MHLERCICKFIPALNFRTRVVLVVHAKELKRTTNTGRLAIQALRNSQLCVRGESKERLDLSGLLSPEYRSCLLYPSEDASDLREFADNGDARPVQLFVPDGNWRQAGKVHLRHPELARVPRVKIVQPNLAQYHLRREHLVEGMSTLEAVAQALTVLEGDVAVQPLFRLYQAKLAATLRGRGLTIADLA